MRVKLVLAFINLLFLLAMACSTNEVSFVTVFDNNKADKAGYFIEGYIVNIDHDLGQKLHLKK